MESRLAMSGTSEQAFQSFFCGASRFAVNGGQFNAITGDYVVDNRVFHGLDEERIALMLQGLFQRAIAERSISRPIGFNRGNGVTIIDAFGREMTLPQSIVTFYSDVHDILIKHFRGKVGEERVTQGWYRLVTEGDGTVVNSDDWNKALETGEAFVMCMLIEQAWEKSTNEACPKCGKTKLGTIRNGGFLTCRRCEKSFVSVEAQKVGVPQSKDVDSFKHVMKALFPRKVQRPSSDLRSGQHKSFYFPGPSDGPGVKVVGSGSITVEEIGYYLPHLRRVQEARQEESTFEEIS